MTLWQKIGCAAGCIVLFVSVVLGIVFYATSGITDTADEFFASAAEGDYVAAHQMAATQLRATRTTEELEQFLVEQGLDKVVETSWDSRSVNNDRGELVGTATNASGSKVALSMRFISEGGNWKITAIDVQPGGLNAPSGDVGGSEPPERQARAAAPAPMVIPDPREQEEMIETASTGLMNALRGGDFEGFAYAWVDGTDMEAVKQQFAGLDEQDGKALFFSEPVFQPATAFDDEGRLVLSGTYPTARGRYAFRYVFAGEGDSSPHLVEMELSR